MTRKLPEGTPTPSQAAAERVERERAPIRAWAAAVEARTPDLTGYQRAAELGISPSFWSSLRHGREHPSLELQRLASEAWGVPAIPARPAGGRRAGVDEEILQIALGLGLTLDEARTTEACVEYIGEAVAYLKRRLREYNPTSARPYRIRQILKRLSR